MHKNMYICKYLQEIWELDNPNIIEEMLPTLIDYMIFNFVKSYFSNHPMKIIVICNVDIYIM